MKEKKTVTKENFLLSNAEITLYQQLIIPKTKTGESRSYPRMAWHTTWLVDDVNLQASKLRDEHCSLDADNYFVLHIF